MKKLYTLSKQLVAAATICLTLFGTPVFAQSICGPIVEDFENTSGSTAGFTGDFSLASVGGGPNSDELLEKQGAIGSAIYTVTTPTYTLPAGANSVGFGFILDGSNRVARIDASIIYVSR